MTIYIRGNMWRLHETKERMWREAQGGLGQG